MLLRIWLLSTFLLSSSLMVARVAGAQEKTFLAPTPVLDGEDAALRKSLYEAWDKLPRELKVSGAVVDGAGKPVSKAKLTVLADIGVELEGRADEEGKFYFEAPATGFYFVTARSEDGSLLAAGTRKETSPEGTLSLQLIAQPTKEVTLQVRSKAGDPIAGAYFGATLAGMVIAKGKCDAEGRFTVFAPESLASATDDRRPEVVHFYAMASGHGLNLVRGEYYEGKFEFPQELILPPAEALAVKVTDRDEKPLAGIPIYLPNYVVQQADSSPDGFTRAYRHVHVPICLDTRSLTHSNDQGEATISWFVTPKMVQAQINGFPVGNNAPIRLSVFAIHPQWGKGVGMITVDGEKIDTICKLYPPSLIRGKVILPDGAPAAGIVLKSVDGPTNRRHTTTDAKGEFEFAANMMDVGLKVDDAKWISDLIKVNELVRQAPEHRVELKLREGKRVTIRVTAGPQYAPLMNQSVRIHGSAFRVEVMTDHEGKAEALLDRGNYQIYAMSEEVRKQLRTPRQGNEVNLLVKDLSHIQVPIHFDIIQPRVIKVTVLKPDGVTPMEKAKVEILNPFKADAKTETEVQRAQAAFGGRNAGQTIEMEREVPVAVSVLTDAAGQAELRAPIDAPAMLMISSEGAKAVVNVDILEDTATITLRNAVTVKGKLIDEATGDAIVGRQMEMKLNWSKLSPNSQYTPQGSSARSREAPSVIATTDEEGNFEFKDLLPDQDYALQVMLPTRPIDGPRPAVREAMIRLSGRGEKAVRTNAEGVTDLGELKAMVYRPPVNPPRAVPFGNPGAAPAPR